MTTRLRIAQTEAMKSKRRKAVQMYHDRVAHRYDDIYDDSYWQWHDALTWGYLKPHLPVRQGEAIIDLGCGTGKWGIKLAQSGYTVTCLDISHKMLEVVRRKVPALGLDAKVTCLHADLMDLSEVPAAEFALAVAFGEALCTVESPAKALKQIYRILKPGGLLVATIDNRLANLDYFLEKGDLAGMERFIKTGRTHWLTKTPEEQFELHTQTPRQLTKLITGAGFEVVEMIGKTVLPVRRYRHLLEDRTDFRTLLALERKLARNPDAVGRAAHLQVTARKPIES